MIFTSLPFIIFFFIFLFLYWVVFNKHLKVQNLLLLTGSYIFYGWADWRLLSFLIVVSALNYSLGIYIEKASNPLYKSLLVYIGLIQGIGGLVYFKYFNFFISSFNDAFEQLNFNVGLQTLHIILPLGISFFTFKTLSYILDVDKGKIAATKDWIVFFNYVSFFPTILSGPIDKARTFIPQLEKTRVFEHRLAEDGLRQILWGLFKKVVIADNLMTYTNQIFNNYESYPGSFLFIGAFLYTIQLYADFSGYSDMAIGIGRLLGFQITKNFDFPFFAQNIAEFWRKWHISLTSWLTEYVFTPLSISFRDYDKAGLALAIVINFTIIGLWHGANWTYVLFGFLHGCYYIPLILRGTMNKKKKLTKNRILPTLREFINILSTFLLVMFTFILFRSESISHAWGYYSTFLTNPFFDFSDVTQKIFEVNPKFIFIVGLSIVLLIFDWLQREKHHTLQFENTRVNKTFRWRLYYLLVFSIIYFQGSQQAFIYFQF